MVGGSKGKQRMPGVVITAQQPAFFAKESDEHHGAARPLLYGSQGCCDFQNRSCSAGIVIRAGEDALIVPAHMVVMRGYQPVLIPQSWVCSLQHAHNIPQRHWPQRRCFQMEAHRRAPGRQFRRDPQHRRVARFRVFEE